MKALNKNTIYGIIAAVLLLLWLAGWLIFRYWMPQYGFSLYNYIPGLFLLFALAFVILYERWDRKSKSGKYDFQTLTNNYIIWKGAKVVVSIIVLILCKRLAGGQFDMFLITFAVFYLAFLGLETMSISSIMKRNADTLDKKNGK